MDKIEVPQVVEDIALRTGQVPWAWRVAEDYVVIVWMSGHKDRYELPMPPLPKMAAAHKKNEAAAKSKPIAPNLMKSIRPRSRKTK